MSSAGHEAADRSEAQTVPERASSSEARPQVLPLDTSDVEPSFESGDPSSWEDGRVPVREPGRALALTRP